MPAARRRGRRRRIPARPASEGTRPARPGAGWGRLMTQVLVIGAGPAGLAAARAARVRGASVTLLDSSDQLGGQFWRHLPEARPAARERILHHGWDTFQSL